MIASLHSGTLNNSSLRYPGSSAVKSVSATCPGRRPFFAGSLPASSLAVISFYSRETGVHKGPKCKLNWWSDKETVPISTLLLRWSAPAYCKSFLRSVKSFRFAISVVPGLNNIARQFKFFFFLRLRLHRCCLTKSRRGGTGGSIFEVQRGKTISLFFSHHGQFN